MRLYFRNRSSGDIEYGLIYGVIALCGLLVARFIPLAGILFQCPFLSLTGLPCPTCGATRTMIHLSRGDIHSALAMNPLIALLVLFGLAWFVFSLVGFFASLPRPAVRLSGSEAIAVRIAIIVLALINWAYLCFHL